MPGARADDQEPPIRTVGIRELSARADEIVREVRATGRPVNITVDGEVVAHVTSTHDAGSKTTSRRWTDQERAAFWQDLDTLTEEISRVWPKGVSAVDA